MQYEIQFVPKPLEAFSEAQVDEIKSFVSRSAVGGYVNYRDILSFSDMFYGRKLSWKHDHREIMDLADECEKLGATPWDVYCHSMREMKEEEWKKWKK